MEIILKETSEDNWVEVSKPKAKVKTTPSKITKQNDNNKRSQQNRRNQNKIHDNSAAKLVPKNDVIESRKRSESEQSKTSEKSSYSITSNVDNDVHEVLIQSPVKSNPWMNTESLSIIKSCDESQLDVSSLDLSLNQLSIHEQRIHHSIKPNDFCNICRNFDVTSSELMNFHTRGLVNTGCACFRNCILQALLSLKPFVSLVSTLLRTVSDPNHVPAPQFAVWRELLTLMQEFATASSDRMVVVSSGKKGLFGGLGGKMTGSVPGRAECITANLYMSGLFQAFQRNIDAIRPPPKVSTRGGKAALGKTTQEDAMEFLTFLLDALHEELAGCDKTERDRLAAEGEGDEGKNNLSVPVSELVVSTESVALMKSGSSDCGSSDTVELEVARLREEEDDESQAPESEGWNTVTKSRVKNVVDAPSKEAVRVAGEASVINRIFHGTLRSEVNYKLKKVNSVTFQRFFTLTLDMGSTAAANALLRKSVFSLGGSGVSKSATRGEAMTIEQCLDTYFQEEVLVENEIKKQLRLEVLPPVLVLQLSRFSYDYNKMIPVKITQEVTYPMELVLPERYMAPDLVDQLHTQKRHGKVDSAGLAVYQLSSVVLHHGEKTQNGHYSTYAREVRPVVSRSEDNHDQQQQSAAVWRAFNDTKVAVLSEQQVLAANSLAYILFYTKK